MGVRVCVRQCKSAINWEETLPHLFVLPLPSIGARVPAPPLLLSARGRLGAGLLAAQNPLHQILIVRLETRTKTVTSYVYYTRSRMWLGARYNRTFFLSLLATIWIQSCLFSPVLVATELVVSGTQCTKWFHCLPVF